MRRTYIPNMLAGARREKGLTQKGLSSIVGIGAMNYSRIERGEQWPRLDIVLKIAAVLGTTIERLYERPTDFKNNKFPFEEIGFPEQSLYTMRCQNRYLKRRGSLFYPI